MEFMDFIPVERDGVILDIYEITRQMAEEAKRLGVPQRCVVNEVELIAETRENVETYAAWLAGYHSGWLAKEGKNLVRVASLFGGARLG